MPRLIRRQSVRDRILSFLNPLDHALDLYTYIESYDWDGVQSTTSTPLGIALNILLFLARVNCSNGAYQGWEDVLIKSTSGKTYGRGWGSLRNTGYFLRYLSWFLAVISAVNSVMCFTKKKKYRMFESNIEIVPRTPNARRVPVNSSPSASPLSTLLSPSKSRHHKYTSTTDVWEVSVWDPTPISLRVFSLFSPAHCAIYFLMLPVTVSSNYLFPSSTSGTTTYLTVLFIEALLSLQLGWLASSFTQQMKDRALVQREVLREYDSKYVHPRLGTLKWDVATQTMDDHFEASVEIYTPQYNRQGFTTHANPNYSEYTTNCAYSSTSGVAATPQIENQLRREQNQYYSTGRLSNQFKTDEETPIKSEWAGRRGRFGSNKTSGAASGANISGVQERNYERQPQQQQQQQDRVKRGLDAFTTIYPDIEDDADKPAFSNSQPLRTNNVILNTPTLQPKRRGLDNHVFSTAAHPEKTARTQDRTSGRDIGTPRRPTFISGVINPNSVGMNGLVNMAVENSRGLSPSKMSSPVKSRARTSSYGASLGMGAFGTPKR
ncbi:hypothetical protein L211DRAFT_836933 [Terfezia boudieri ATCC MYA-4762]|uniref:Nuclear rim protein 1 n=1 Tax=Terfezia boudieri ATCC MYA-4762 TaxID=1051890 RepID=A0A3N4LQ98_9PEZI|nr:hypothetical protein L211DRAFT_836933 [Terfezia boudieri ATCC MYA-4762]